MGSVEFLVSIFYCSQTTALSQAFPPYIIPFCVVISHVVVRHGWLILGYTGAISYPLGLFALSMFGGVYSAETHHAVWADDGKQVLSHKG